jgi:riboflavin biosynthesis pyrimidine reductase
MPTFRIDRLWPDPAADLDLDEEFADLALPAPPPGRPLVGVNMVTSIDGRAQRSGHTEGLAGRADRRLLQLYRAAYDAVGSGVGTLRADDFHSHLPADLAARRVAAGRPPQPTAVLLAGRRSVPTDRGWFGHADQARLLVVGSEAGDADLPPGTERLVAPTHTPEPIWILEELALRGIGAFLLEGGPTLNAAFEAEQLIDELYWTIGARLVGGAGLAMLAGGPPGVRDGELVSVHRSDDDLFLRYRLAGIAS